MTQLERSPTLLLAGTAVSDAMRAGVVECQPDADVKDVAQLMAAHAIHCVVVAGIERRERGGDRLAWGIVSDLDLIGALAPGTPAASAGRLAATEIVTVEPTDSLEHAAQLMADHDTHHLVVASSASGRPVGVLSTLDIARAVGGG
jgi:CBS domain-containing protein